MIDLQQLQYKFNLRAWLLNLPFDRRNAVIQKICSECGQGRYTIKRIMYMKPDDTTYVRPETKAAICAVFGKSLSELDAQSALAETHNKPNTEIGTKEKRNDK